VDAKDHDDAVHAERDPSGQSRRLILRAPLPDVAAYARPGASARSRGAGAPAIRSIFPDRVVANAAGADFQRPYSLRPNEDPGAAARIVVGAMAIS